MADLKISELAALAGVDLAASDLLPVVDVSASETKRITVTDLVGNATTLIADATIPGAKILFTAGQLAGTALANGGVGTTQLADDAVTAAKLANESTVDLVTTLPGSGAFTGQLALDTDDLKVYCWDGSAWQSIKAAGSVNTVVGSTAGLVNITIATSGDQVTVSASLDSTGAANQFLAGPTDSGGAVSYRVINPSDLPTATTSAKGAVQVNGEGLRMDGTVVEIDNDVTARATHSVVTYSAKGLITGGRAIEGSDLPLATGGGVGAVQPGTGLTVTGGGVLNHTNTVAGATATKITYDAQGHVTAGTTLDEADIPSLAASKITSGTLSMSLVGSNAITGVKLANASTVKFGGAGSTEGVVTFPAAEFQGQYFFDALNGDLYLYDGAAWQPITITAGELVYGGTYNANLNQVKTVTAAGSAAGLVVNAALPNASNSNLRYYVVVSDSGTGTAPAPTVALAPPDMLVSSGTTWDLIDISNAIAGQIASNISFTPYGNISATNVQTALQEIEDEKLAKAGGTVTGTLEIGSAGSLVFEGSTADANETTLTVVDPTADRTITLPNVSGTVITSGDTGTVTSAMLAGTIADSKLDTISTANKVSVSAIDIDGATDVGSALVDADLFLVDDGGGGTNRKAAATRITDYAFGKVSGDVTIASNGTAAIGSGVIVNADVNASAAIAGTKISPDFGSQTVTTTGQVLSGTSTALTNVYAIGTVLTPAVQIQGTTANGAALSITRNSNAAANLLLQRGATGTPVADTEAVGQISFNGFDGTNYYNAALIRAVVDGTPGAGDMPGRLSFQTTPTGSTTPVERLRLDPAGQILAASLGTVSLPVWSFTGDPNTGIYSPSADQFAVTTNGVERVEWGTGEAVFNDAGNDYDFRVEGDTNTHLLFLDANVDRLGINQSAPATKLDLSGNYGQNIVAVGALDIDCSAGNYFTKTINGASTFTVSSVPATRSYSFTLELTHTSGAITWFAGVEWPGGTAPTLTTGKTHLFMFITDDGGTRWRASSLINYTN